MQAITDNLEPKISEQIAWTKAKIQAMSHKQGRLRLTAPFVMDPYEPSVDGDDQPDQNAQPEQPRPETPPRSRKNFKIL